MSNIRKPKIQPYHPLQTLNKWNMIITLTYFYKKKTIHTYTHSSLRWTNRWRCYCSPYVTRICDESGTVELHNTVIRTLHKSRFSGLWCRVVYQSFRGIRPHNPEDFDLKHHRREGLKTHNLTQHSWSHIEKVTRAFSGPRQMNIAE
jgi:hypothetical protein